METNTKNHVPEDEIDITSMGRKMRAVISYPISLLLSHIYTTFVFILLAVVVSASLKFILPKTYTSSFIIRPNDKHERFHLQMLADIQTLLKNKEYASVANELKISPKISSQITKIDVYNSSFKNAVDSINYSVITIETLDYNQFLPIQNSLLGYLENNPYFLKIKGIQKEQIERELFQVNRDIIELDSLKKLQLSNYTNQKMVLQTNFLLNDLINPMASYGMAVDRMNKKTNLMARKEFVNNFEIIKSCVVIKYSSWPPRILVMCLFFIPLFLILCVVFLHIKQKKNESRKSL